MNEYRVPTLRVAVFKPIPTCPIHSFIAANTYEADTGFAKIVQFWRYEEGIPG